jgi:hypothetical protein
VTTDGGRLITEKIVPLQELVAARWKTVFRGSRPLLKLDSSGELKLVRGDAEIAFGDMSAGERAVALLVTRLLVLSVTSPNAFMRAGCVQLRLGDVLIHDHRHTC